ncbi:hypothetical protein [Xylella fastidiosa]|uniref:hypothetical protein n=1 Tax=Xylella fastidiosa TaxID=2371 RepID=UPI0013A584E7|nr:hypothetical protein [Xylella fastidiosa]WGZ35308.1 hypothetical protein O4445_05420 [Xylella fastidiosa subsp. pauca]
MDFFPLAGFFIRRPPGHSHGAGHKKTAKLTGAVTAAFGVFTLLTGDGTAAANVGQAQAVSGIEIAENAIITRAVHGVAPDIGCPCHHAACLMAMRDAASDNTCFKV